MSSSSTSSTSGSNIRMTPSVPSHLPLAGVRVVEFCSTAAGPFCAMLLADMGADVVKVEPPAGDGLRQWPPLNQGYSENFASLNRNKQSVVLDLKQPADHAVAHGLIMDADIVVENNRPGVMDRLGLGYADFRAARPQLLYCSISAYGQSGPRAGEGGFDLTIQASAGVMSVTGEAEGAPVKCGVPVSDFASGLYAAFAIAAALAEVRAGGRGAHIDIPMFGCTLAIAALQTSEYFGTGRSPGKLGSAHPRNAPYQAFQAADGYFAIAAGNHKLWLDVLGVVQLPALAQDERFLTTTDRARNQLALKQLLEQRFAQHPVEHWISAFNAAGVPHARINDYAGALADPQTAHMQWVQPLTLPGGEQTRTFASPIRMDGAGFPVRARPPALGEHTDLIRARHAARAGGAAGVADADGAQAPTDPRHGPSGMLQGPAPLGLLGFVRAMTQLVSGPDRSEAQTLEAAGALLARLVARDDWLPEALAQPHPQYYQQHLIYGDPLDRFSLVSFVWGPGQKTPIHDHTVWGIIGMLRGAEVAPRFERTAQGRLQPLGQGVRLEPGQLDFVSPRIGDIHEVRNAFEDRVSISIHLYGANIGRVRRHVYAADTGAAREFVSGYSNALVPNLWSQRA